jgi:glucosyl-3-phosphoglycerate synthase
VIDDKKASLDLKTKLSKGKGWNLWSSLYYLNTDMVFWLDADIENMSDKFILGIVGPMLKDKSVKFVKGYYQRPKNDSRVTEILARPILNAWFPKTKDIIQPLSGEYGGRRDFLESISFYSGYSVEVAVLIQAVNRLRSGNIVQSYLGSRKHELQSVLNLGKMGASIFQTLLDIADKEKSIKIQKAVSNELIQFLSEDGIKFNPQKYTVKDKELLPIISNSNYARAQI